MKALGLALAIWAAALVPPAAADPAEGVGAAAAGIAAARARLEAARTGENRAAAMTGAVAAYERALGVMRAQLIGAEAEADRIRAELDARREKTAHLLSALIRLSRIPPPVQGLHPAGPLGAARAGGMLAQMTPALALEAADLRATLAALGQARRLREAGEADLRDALDVLSAARSELVAALPARAEPAAEIDADLLQRMSRDSDTLTGFAEAVAGLPSAASDRADPPPPMPWPVAGEVLRGFNEPDAAGVERPGLLMAAAPLAIVTAPAEGAVRYAGPFLDYGYVVILEPRAGTLLVLAGMQALFVAAGTAVERGEAIGQLGGRDLGVEEFLIPVAEGTGAPRRETLYIELRFGQEPVDPRPWFAGDDG